MIRRFDHLYRQFIIWSQRDASVWLSHCEYWLTPGGRLRGENVLDTDYDASAIVAAVRRGLFDDDFRALCRSAPNPYWLGDAGSKIADVLAQVPLDQTLIRKRMTLRGEVRDGWFR